MDRAEIWLDAIDGELGEAPKPPLSGPRTWRLLAVLGMLLTLPTLGAWPAILLTGLFLGITGQPAAAAAFAAALAGSITHWCVIQPTFLLRAGQVEFFSEQFVLHFAPGQTPRAQITQIDLATGDRWHLPVDGGFVDLSVLRRGNGILPECRGLTVAVPRSAASRATPSPFPKAAAT